MAQGVVITLPFFTLYKSDGYGNVSATGLTRLGALCLVTPIYSSTYLRLVKVSVERYV